MPISIERTDTEFVIRLPLTVDPTEIQRVLEYLQFVEIVSRSQATDEDIDQLSKEVKAGWPESVKKKLSQMEEFKGLFEG